MLLPTSSGFALQRKKNVVYICKSPKERNLPSRVSLSRKEQFPTDFDFHISILNSLLVQQLTESKFIIRKFVIRIVFRSLMSPGIGCTVQALAPAGSQGYQKRPYSEVLSLTSGLDVLLRVMNGLFSVVGVRESATACCTVGPTDPPPPGSSSSSSSRFLGVCPFSRLVFRLRLE
jgi:hypothetical protein